MDNNKIKMYWEATKNIFGAKKGEEWLDNNSQFLPDTINSVEDAEREIQNHIHNKLQKVFSSPKTK